MICFVIACVYILFKIIFGNAPFEVVFTSATTFMLYWYCITTAITVGLLVMIMAGVGSIAGFVSGSGSNRGFGRNILFSLIGLGGATSLTLGASFFIFLRRIIYISSSYLLSISVTTMAVNDAVWNLPYLIIGSFLLLLALKWRN